MKENPMTLLDQLKAERRQRADTTNEAIRRENDPNRWRTDAERARMATTDAARIKAEQAFNAAGLESQAATRALDGLGGDDWASKFWVDMQPNKMTKPMAEAVNRAKRANAAVDEARVKLQAAIRDHRRAEQEIGAAATARRRAARVAAGEIG